MLRLQAAAIDRYSIAGSWHRRQLLNLYLQQTSCTSLLPSIDGTDRRAGGRYPVGWRRGIVVSGVRRMNEVNARRARLVLGGMMGDRLRAGIPSRYVASQLSLA